MSDAGAAQRAHTRLQAILKAVVVGQDVSDPASREAGESETLFSSAGALEPPYDPAARCLLVDRRIAAHVTRTQVNFVTDELGRRVEGFGAEARRIVAEGLEAGLGREDLSAALQAAAQDALAGRSAFYWDVVAGAFVGNGRSYAQLSSYAEAGIARYLIEAVLDERTTEICRYLHGKVFEVGDALRRFDALDRLDAPEDVKQAQPWVREATDAATGHRVLYVDRGGVRTPIVEVTRSGFGARDDRGDHGRSVSNRELMDLGVSFPPYHGLCRTTTLPDV